jgi:hypothetical protein
MLGTVGWCKLMDTKVLLPKMPVFVSDSTLQLEKLEFLPLCLTYPTLYSLAAIYQGTLGTKMSSTQGLTPLH